MKLQFSKGKMEVGCDEAGRGCLAGPVFAAAVILSEDFKNERINDSKKVSEKERTVLREIIEENALAWSVAYIEPLKIDEINILNSSILAMHKAIEGLKLKPEYILVDGNRFKNYQNIPHTCMIKGDARFLNIAAASILAKTHRDEYMMNIHKEFPQYDWINNKGYPTKKHREAIAKFGITKYHRKSFKLLPDQLELDL